MGQTVIHQPRVAWDGALAFVRAAAGNSYEAFAGRVFQHLGIVEYGALGDTRSRILEAQADMPGDQRVLDIEAAKWRVRLQDLMQEEPDLIPVIQDLSR
jgi:hypothetical protein